jgi:arginine exporter protein ArgO
MHAVLTGMAAGYGIAIPIGAIAVLIIDIGLRDGFTTGFWAGAGAATADALYAAVAVVLGSLAVAVLGTFAVPLRIVSGLALLALGVLGLLRSHARTKASGPQTARARELAVYGQFLGLTLLNPMTVVYFVALILGGAAGSETSNTARLLFVFGAAMASLSWQTLLAASAAIFHRRLSLRAKMSLSIAGNLVVCAFGLDILAQQLAL